MSLNVSSIRLSIEIAASTSSAMPITPSVPLRVFRMNPLIVLVTCRRASSGRAATGAALVAAESGASGSGDGAIAVAPVGAFVPGAGGGVMLATSLSIIREICSVPSRSRMLDDTLNATASMGIMASREV